jgi:hypothetical protein
MADKLRNILNTRLTALGEGMEEELEEIDLSTLPKKRKRKIIERRGTGRDFSAANTEAIRAQLRAKLKASTPGSAFHTRILNQLAELNK